MMKDNTSFETELDKTRDKLSIFEDGLSKNIAWLYAISGICICIIGGIWYYIGYLEIFEDKSLKSSIFKWFVFLMLGLLSGHGFELLKYNAKKIKLFKVNFGLLPVAIMVAVFFPYVTSFYPEFFIAIVVFVASSTFFQIHYSIQEGIEKDLEYLNLLEILHNEGKNTKK